MPAEPPGGPSGNNITREDDKERRFVCQQIWLNTLQQPYTCLQMSQQAQVNSSSDEESVEEMSAYIYCQSLVELFAAAAHLPADTPAGPNGNSLSDEESAANQECISVWGSFLLTVLQHMCAWLQIHQQAQVATACLMRSLWKNGSSRRQCKPEGGLL